MDRISRRTRLATMTNARPAGTSDHFLSSRLPTCSGPPGACRPPHVPSQVGGSLQAACQRKSRYPTQHTGAGPRAEQKAHIAPLIEG